MYAKVLVFASALIALYIFPVNLHAASGEKFSHQGYHFDISATQMSDDILVHGIISGGESLIVDPVEAY
jgi:hypothetical protein